MGSHRQRRLCLPSRCGTIFFVGPPRYNPQRIVRQRPLQRLCLVPRRAHPHIALFIGCQDHRHGLGMYRFDNRVRRRGQETIEIR
jgi:hypothetical protein